MEILKFQTPPLFATQNWDVDVRMQEKEKLENYWVECRPKLSV